MSVSKNDNSIETVKVSLNSRWFSMEEMQQALNSRRKKDFEGEEKLTLDLTKECLGSITVTRNNDGTYTHKLNFDTVTLVLNDEQMETLTE